MRRRVRVRALNAYPLECIEVEVVAVRGDGRAAGDGAWRVDALVDDEVKTARAGRGHL